MQRGPKRREPDNASETSGIIVRGGVKDSSWLSDERFARRTRDATRRDATRCEPDTRTREATPESMEL